MKIDGARVMSGKIGRMLRRQLLEDPEMLAELGSIAQVKEYLQQAPEENEDLVRIALKAIDWQIVFDSADVADLKERADKLYDRERGK